VGCSILTFSNVVTTLILNDASISVTELCGTYYFVASSSHVSTLVLNTSGHFWHSLYIRSDKSASRPKRRTCATLPWRRGEGEEEKWEVLEVLGSWHESSEWDERSVILTLEQWRGASKCGLPPRLRERGGELDRMMGKVSIRLFGTCHNGVRTLHRTLDMCDSDESPEEFGTLALLGFSSRYADQRP